MKQLLSNTTAQSITEKDLASLASFFEVLIEIDQDLKHNQQSNETANQ